MTKALSQEELARHTSLDRTYVSCIEGGRRNVGLRNVHALAAALAVTIAQLLDGLA